MLGYGMKPIKLMPANMNVFTTTCPNMALVKLVSLFLQWAKENMPEEGLQKKNEII